MLSVGVLTTSISPKMYGLIASDTRARKQRDLGVRNAAGGMQVVED